MPKTNLPCAAMLAALLLSPTAGFADDTLGEATYEPRNADFDDAVLRYLRDHAPKIVGGKPATADDYPWQVALLVSWIADTTRAHFCGGSILDERWIVTAAHCIHNLPAADVHVVAGATDLGIGVLRINAARLLVHRDYDARTKNYDVALVELRDRLQLGASIRPIGLIDAAEEDAVLTAGTMLTVTGWGATVEGGNSVKALQEVDVPFVTREACRDPLSYGERITENMICAGRGAGGQDSCQGDSGGPLVRRDGANATLVGIVSWGEGCARPGRYGVYTRISRFTDWIRDCAAGSEACE